VILNFIDTLTVIIHYYVSIISFLTLPIYYKLETESVLKNYRFKKEFHLKFQCMNSM